MGSIRHIVGCMTGTSIDGLDAALVRAEGSGLSMRAAFLRGRSCPLGDLGPRLRSVAEQQPMTAGEIARLSRDLALFHARQVRALLDDAGTTIDLVCVHGQTVFHAPPVSWQLFNPAPLAEALGVPVVFDLRAADLASGGQGAPITPLADWILFRHEREPRAIVNLGGFCNVTLLPPGDDPGTIDRIRGFDVCACNHLLDGVARSLLGRPYDDGGAAALSGTVNDDALEDLGGVLESQFRHGRSLGTGDELGEWVSRFRARVAPTDIAATACEGLGQFIARRIADSEMPPARLLLAGGGANNAALVRSIGDWASAKVAPVDVHGIPAAYREAACMAVLGALSADGVAITLPAVTGVRCPAPVAGAWFGRTA